MSFSFRFDTNTKELIFDVDGAKVKLTFDGSVINITGSNGGAICYTTDQPTGPVNGLTAASTTALTNGLPTASTTGPVSQFNLDSSFINQIPSAPVRTGVTTYIHNVLRGYGSITGLNTRYDVTHGVGYLVSDEAIAIITRLHKVDPRLNGVCMEGLLYQSLCRWVRITDTYLDPYNFNSICSLNVLETKKNDPDYQGLINDVLNMWSSVDFDARTPVRIAYKDYQDLYATRTDHQFGLTGTENDILGLILYAITYGYINGERKGFDKNNYTVDNIRDYAREMIAMSTSLFHLTNYLISVASSIGGLRPAREMLVDVPITEFKTKSYVLNGNIDLMILWESHGKQHCSIVDIKCCKSDDSYSRTDWPQQLNLYAYGMKSEYNIHDLYIVNVYTNRLFKYQFSPEFNPGELV